MRWQSTLVQLESSSEATSLGSFAIERAAPVFTPWGSGEAPLESERAVDLEVMQADAFAQGFEQGRRSVELEFEGEREALARLAESLDVLRPQETNALALLLTETVDRLVRQIVGQVEVNGALLTARAQAAAALIGQETDAARLRLNPADLPLIEAARIPVEIVGDDNIERGGLLLETGQGWIEDGPAVRLDRLRAELDRMGAPR
jgi:flagellar assembly protein FliH